MVYDYTYYRNQFNKYNTNNPKNYLINDDYILDNNRLDDTKISPNNDNKNKEISDTNVETRNNSDETILNIFGVKLAFDDLLILGLLYLLYTEDIKDISLYLVLILLLLN